MTTCVFSFDLFRFALFIKIFAMNIHTHVFWFTFESFLGL